MAGMNLDFVLLLGDLIYADFPIQYGTDVESFRSHYRRVHNERDFTSLFSKTPAYFIYDDHEIKNNWGHNTTDPYNNGIKAFHEYVGRTNPITFFSNTEPVYYFTFNFGAAASFFVLDCRRFRNSERGELLGDIQLQRLKDWLYDGIFVYVITFFLIF